MEQQNQSLLKERNTPVFYNICGAKILLYTQPNSNSIVNCDSLGVDRVEFVNWLVQFILVKWSYLWQNHELLSGSGVAGGVGVVNDMGSAVVGVNIQLCGLVRGL